MLEQNISCLSFVGNDRVGVRPGQSVTVYYTKIKNLSVNN